MVGAVRQSFTHARLRETTPTVVTPSTNVLPTMVDATKCARTPALLPVHASAIRGTGSTAVDLHARPSTTAPRVTVWFSCHILPS